MSGRALILQHVPHEGPGRVLDALIAGGYTAEICRLDEGAPVPRSLDSWDALVVMGGPMGVGDLADPRWPFLRDEVALLAQAAAADFPTLGICLGAQLLAYASGAAVAPNRRGEPPVLVREVGWGPVTLTPAGERDPAWDGLGPFEMVLHWHGDAFEVPQGAELLASTLTCPPQMFRLHRRLYGMQFHAEVRAEDVDRWVEVDAAFVRAANGADGAALIRRETRRLMPAFEARGGRLLTNIIRAWRADASSDSSG